MRLPESTTTLRLGDEVDLHAVCGKVYAPIPYSSRSTLD